MNQVRNERGMALVWSIVLLVTLLTAVGVLIRTSQTAYAHHRVQLVIDEKAIKILAIEAGGIHEIGSQNNLAKGFIDARRDLEDIYRVCNVYCPYLIPLIQALRVAQMGMEAWQQAVRFATIARATAAMWVLPKDVVGKVSLTFYPPIPKLYYQEMRGYEHETGAPRELEADFENKQTLKITAKMSTDKFLMKRPTTQNLENTVRDMHVYTKAKVQMPQMEGRWKVILAPVDQGARPLLSSRWP